MKTMIEKIQNWTDLVSELADRMLQADIDCNQYQTDIYLYVNDDGSWELEDFVNVGGNSWLNDTHITVWCDMEHLENWMDWYNTLQDVSDTLQACEWVMSVDDLKQQIANWLNQYQNPDDPFVPDDIYLTDVWLWMAAEAKEDSGMQEMLEDLKAAYVESLKERYSDYLERAEAALIDAVEVSEND